MTRRRHTTGISAQKNIGELAQQNVDNIKKRNRMRCAGSSLRLRCWRCPGHSAKAKGPAVATADAAATATAVAADAAATAAAGGAVGSAAASRGVVCSTATGDCASVGASFPAVLDAYM